MKNVLRLMLIAGVCLSFQASAYTPAGIPDYTIADSIGSAATGDKYDYYSATCSNPGPVNSTAEFTLRDNSSATPRLSIQVGSGSYLSSVISTVASTDPATGLPNYAATINQTVYYNQSGNKVWTIKVNRPKATSSSVRNYTLFVRCSTDPDTDHAVAFSQTTNQ